MNDVNVNADVTNVFPPDEEDVANVFNNLRGLCNRKAVSSSDLLHVLEIIASVC